MERGKISGTFDASTVDADSESLAGSTSSKSRRRRWFGNSKTVSGKTSSISSTLPASNNNSSVDLGRITSTPSPSRPGRSVSRPISIPQSQKLSSYSGSPSGSGSYGREGSVHGSAAHSDLSARDKEIANSQDRLDRWGTRATGGIERAERELGLGDEVNMGLS
jgi:hypothetical protein